MATFKDISSSIGRTANKAIKKTNEIADTASLHIKVKTLEGKLSKKFEELGKLTYKQLKDGVSQAEKIADTIKEIDGIKANITSVKDKIEADKKARAERKEAEKAEKAAKAAEAEAEAEAEVTESCDCEE